jgi:hypothetical protein
MITPSTYISDLAPARTATSVAIFNRIATCSGALACGTARNPANPQKSWPPSVAVIFAGVAPILGHHLRDVRGRERSQRRRPALVGQNCRLGAPQRPVGEAGTLSGSGAQTLLVNRESFRATTAPKPGPIRRRRPATRDTRWQCQSRADGRFRYWQPRRPLAP